MVQVTLRCRPKNGYHYVGKIKSVTLDSSARLELLLQRSTTASGGRGGQPTSAHDALYLDGRKLPLNTAIATHNLEENVILETCKSPVMSAVLTAVMKDLDRIQKKINPRQRNRETLGPLLQLPPEYLTDEEHDSFWKTQWDNETIKSRKICLAIMKMVLQRDDRYAIHDLDPSIDCNSLYENMQEVWNYEDQNGIRNGGRKAFNSNRHLFKPQTKRTGKPSTLWTLVHYKHQQQIKIAATYDIQLGRNDSTINGSEDALEEFIRLDSMRHENGGRNGAEQAVQNTTTASQGTRNRRRGNQNPQLSNTTEAVPTAAATVVVPNSNRRRAPKDYCPVFQSGPFAILCALMESVEGENGRRQLSLTETRLKKLAQPRCRANLYDKQTSRSRNAFQCMVPLVSKGLLKKEMADRQENGLWMFEAEGEKLGRECLKFEKAFNSIVPPHVIEDSNGNDTGHRSIRMPLLVIDDREDPHFRARLRELCEDDHIENEERSLPAGDYLFIQRSQSDGENVIPIIIERKSWSDLADSVNGKGRQKRRLDCVKIGTNWSRCEQGNCQLCKMKRSGCAQIMFIIEGTRCHGRDIHRSTCTAEKRCQQCRALQERHDVDMTQDKLEKVLHRLQVEHGCYVHFTRSYNETIFSLFTIRNFLQDGGSFASSLYSKISHANITNATTNLLSYEDFCSNAGSSRTSLKDTAQKKGRVVEWEASDLADKILDKSCHWKTRFEQELMGMEEDNEISQKKRSASSIENSDEGEAGPKRKRRAIDIEREREMKFIFESQESAINLEDSDEEGNPNNGEGGDQSIIEIQESQGSIHILDESQDDSVMILDELQDESQDSIKIVDPIDDQEDANRYITDTNDVPGERANVVPNRATDMCTLLLIKGWDDYEKKRSSVVDKFWQKVYSDYRSALTQNLIPANTTSDPSTEVLDGLKQAGVSAETYVRRRMFISVTLWMQVKLGVNVRTVEREMYAMAMKEGWNGNGNVNYNLLIDNNNQLGRPATEHQTITSNERMQEAATPLRGETVNDVRHTPLTSNRHNEVDNNLLSVRGPQRPSPSSAGRIKPNAHSSSHDQSSSRRLQLREARLLRFGGGSESETRSTVCNRGRNPHIAGDAIANTSQRDENEVDEIVYEQNSNDATWQCSLCTFENDNFHAFKCESCFQGMNPFMDDTHVTPQTLITSSTWQCSECTLENDISVTKCDACSNDRVQADNCWKCPRCTLDNVATTAVCSICEYNRSSFVGTSTEGSSSVQADNCWKCPLCTVENRTTTDVCTTCEYNRSSSVHKPSPVGSSRLDQIDVSSRINYMDQTGHTSMASSNVTRNISHLLNEDMRDSSRQPLHVSSMDTASSSPVKVKRVMRCGACKLEGHNRSNATPQNCPAYYDPKEVAERLKKRQKIQERAREAEENHADAQRRRQRNQARLEEMERLHQEHREEAQRMERLEAEDEKRKRRRAETLRRKANRLGL